MTLLKIIKNIWILPKQRENFVDLTEKELEKNGFVNINEKSELKKGDKIYFNNRNKNIIAVIVGNDIKAELI